MLLLLFFIISCIFLLLAFSVVAITEMSIERNIRNELLKHGYKLMSINSTKRKIPIKKEPTPFWRKHLVVDYYAGNHTHYKNITFSNDEGHLFQSVVAIETSPFWSHKLYFELDLKHPIPNSKPEQS